jgi:hypothetical protein
MGRGRGKPWLLEVIRGERRKVGRGRRLLRGDKRRSSRGINDVCLL